MHLRTVGKSHSGNGKRKTLSELKSLGEYVGRFGAERKMVGKRGGRDTVQTEAF